MNRLANWFSKNQDVVFIVLVLSIFAIIFIPLPTYVMDLLLVSSITMSMLILISVIYLKQPVEFSVFPSILIITITFRLALNIATTRMILSNAGELGSQAAGQVIQTFGQFVASGDPLIGLVIFLLIIIVNYLVISKGAGRISEVAARFTLDALPGKQMAIDSDFNQGGVSQQEANERRKGLASQADFYGSMDGATKFIRGEAIAGLIIIMVDIIGGLVIGLAKYSMSIKDALNTFTILTIGDGLVSQLPALIVSVAAGILVSRKSECQDLGRDFFNQLFMERKGLLICSLFLVFLLITPLPKLQLILVAGLLYLAYRSSRSPQTTKVASGNPPKEEPEQQTQQIEAVELELGVKIALTISQDKLLKELSALRNQVREELGVIIPPVMVKDNLKLPASHFVIKIRTNKVFEASAEAKAQADCNIIESLSTAIKQHAHELLTRDMVRRLIKDTSKTVLDDAINDSFDTSQLQRLLKSLLYEGVPIRDMPLILDAVCGLDDSQKKDPDLVLCHVRKALARTISVECTSKDGAIHAIEVNGDFNGADLNGELIRLKAEGFVPVVLCSPEARSRLTRLMRPLGAMVITHDEVVDNARLEIKKLVPV